MAWRRRLASTLAAAAAIGALPALAQQGSPSGSDRLILLEAPNPTAAGKPTMFKPGSSDETGREPLFDRGWEAGCRIRLRGVIDKNGGVAIEGTAFTW